MGEIRLLDCTLRDGGYVIDWNFGHDNLVSIFERLVDANVDYIEIGFLDDRRPFDIDRSIMPDTDSVARIYGDLDRKQAMVVGMIDYGTCSLSHIKPCSECYLDAIRVIFKKHLRKEALEYCAELKKLGYKVFAQLVSVTSYEDEEMLELIRLANEVEPYAVSMVDTYGLMHQDNLKHYFDLLNEHLKPQIGLGYHAHNNFQMGYANCIEMISQNTDRMMLVDGTIYGMGKSAGNAPTELVAMYLNGRRGKHYHISQILEAIDSNIMNYYTPATWGYNMFYYLAASNDCHPNYVSYLIDKRTLSVKSINELLGKLQGEKKLLYDRSYIEELYKEYQDNDINDTEHLRILGEKLSQKDVLIIGPGLTIKEQKDTVYDFIRKNDPIIVSVNFLPSEYDTDYIFLTNSKRYVQLASVLARKREHFQIIAASNVTKTSGEFDYMVNNRDLLDFSAEVIDNSFIMVLKLMEKLNVRKVYLAGFDGYHGGRNQDYVNSWMEYKFNKKQAQRINEYVSQMLDTFKEKMQIVFITDSLYM